MKKQSFLTRVPCAFLAICVFTLTRHAQATPPAFTDVTEDANVNYLQWDKPFSSSEVNFLTGGAAAGDVNADGYPDLYVTRLDGPDVLFINNQMGAFTDGTAAAGLNADLPTNGASMADIDNDGDLDLYVTSVGETRHYLYINDGTGHFTEQGVERNAVVQTTASHRGMSTAFGDYDNDGYLDMYVSEWGFLGVTPPALRSHSRLLRNLGQSNPGHFEDTTLESGIYLDDSVAFGPAATFGGVFAFTPIFADFDKDGHADLAIAGDFHTSRLYWNNGDGTFTQSPGGPVDLDEPLPDGHSGIGTDENGMGAAVADFNGDGLLDWFVTSIYDPDDPCGDGFSCNWDETGNRLYLNNGDRTFTDVTDDAGVRDGGWGWGATFLDYDNDGDQDLTMTNGVLFGNSHAIPFHTDQVRLWRNDGEGVFDEVATTEGVTDTGSGKGILTLDYDKDGDLDLFVVNNAGTPKLYRNNTDDSAASIIINLQGKFANASGVGAWVTIVTDPGADPITQYVQGGSNFLSQNEPIVHFGLGDRTEPIHMLTVEWSSGNTNTYSGLAVDSAITVTEVPEPASAAAIALVSLPWLRSAARSRQRQP